MPCLGALPVVHQFIPVDFGPFHSQGEGSPGQAASNDLKGLDGDFCDIFAVPDVEVRLTVVPKIHLNSKAIESTDLRHGNFRRDVYLIWYQDNNGYGVV